MRRLSRTRRQRIPPDQLKAQAAKLREIAPDDPKVTALCDAVEEMIAADAGVYVRKGGGEATKPRTTPAAAGWKRPPPEWGEK